MKQLTLFKEEDEKEVQSEEELATTSVGNSAYRKATEYMKPEGTRYWATTQVKGLSPENISVSVADAVHLAEGNMLITVKRGSKHPTG